MVDASLEGETKAVVDRMRDRAPMLYLRSRIQSAAQQRNLGAASVSTPLIAFVDDDVVLPVETFSRLVTPFEGENGETIGGVAGRIKGLVIQNRKAFYGGITDFRLAIHIPILAHD